MRPNARLLVSQRGAWLAGKRECRSSDARLNDGEQRPARGPCLGGGSLTPGCRKHLKSQLKFVFGSLVRAGDLSQVCQIPDFGAVQNRTP